MVLQIAHITKDRPDLLHLLEEAYRDIYVPAFPDENERESLEKFKKAVDGGFPGVQVVINILGERLEDPDNYVVKGISVGYYYEKQNVGLLAYNAISPEHRESGLGKLMVQSRIESMQKMAQARGKTLAGVFIECNDPLKVSPDMDSMDPSKRIQIFESWGARQIPIDYVQPPVSQDGYYYDRLVLLNYPLDGKYAGKKCVEAFLRAIYRDERVDQIDSTGTAPMRRVLRAEDDHYFREMKKQLDAATLDDLPACPVPGYKKGVPAFNFFR
jgi:hypothetical protein